MTLPLPTSVPAEAEALAAESGADAVNVVVAGDPDPAGVELDRGYFGPGAGDLGRLAAAVEAIRETGGRLHYPVADTDTGTDGPWLVLEPLDGVISTVHAGTGQVDVLLRLDGGSVDALLRDVRDRFAAVIEAARPSHERYPVREDGHGVFTRGMTTYAPDSVTVADGADRASVVFSVSTTPDTSADAVESTFESVDVVSSATYRPAVAVERASPSEPFRRVVERAHRQVVGDWQYEWAPEPTIFSHVPTDEKVAVGIGSPGGGLSAAEYRQCVDLLSACLRELPA